MESVNVYADNAWKAVFYGLKAVLGLDIEEANGLVRDAMEHGESLPFNDFRMDETRCYIKVQSGQFGGQGTREREYTEYSKEAEGKEGLLQQRSKLLDGIQYSLVFYGKDANEFAEMAEVGLLEDDEAVRLFRGYGIAIVSDSMNLVRLRELYNGVWITRRDLSFGVYRVREYTSDIGAIEVAPVITLGRD